MAVGRTVFSAILAVVVAWQAVFAAHAYNAGNRVAATIFAVGSVAALSILAASRRTE